MPVLKHLPLILNKRLRLLPHKGRTEIKHYARIPITGVRVNKLMATIPRVKG